MITLVDAFLASQSYNFFYIGNTILSVENDHHTLPSPIS